MNIVALWNQLYRVLMKVPFIFYLVMIAVYFWLNGEAHFPNWESTYSTLIMPYIVMMLAFVVWARARAEQRIEVPAALGIVSFVGAFFATWMVMLIAISIGVFDVPDFNSSMLLPTLIIQVCVVATAEELMFRGVLLNLFGPQFGLWIQAFLFALWHSYAYQIVWYDLSATGLNLIALGVAFLFGIILGLVAMKKELGLPAAIGIHAAYNLAVLGALTIL